jgi:hypothetical protein
VAGRARQWQGRQWQGQGRHRHLEAAAFVVGAELAKLVADVHLRVDLHAEQVVVPLHLRRVFAELMEREAAAAAAKKAKRGATPTTQRPGPHKERCGKRSIPSREDYELA